MGFKLRHMISIDKTFNWLTFCNLASIFKLTGGRYANQTIIYQRNRQYYIKPYSLKEDPSNHIICQAPQFNIRFDENKRSWEVYDQTLTAEASDVIGALSECLCLLCVFGMLFRLDHYENASIQLYYKIAHIAVTILHRE